MGARYGPEYNMRALGVQPRRCLGGGGGKENEENLSKMSFLVLFLSEAEMPVCRLARERLRVIGVAYDHDTDADT